jgi:allophanate hydrolase subunit 2
MGSRSTDTLAGIGPPRLEAGAVIPLGRRADAVAAGERRAPIAASEESAAADVQVVRVVPGPRDSWLTEAGLRTLTDSEWTVSPASDRTGVRLRGPMLERRPLGELASEALLTGAVQVPPDGQPIVFLANRPTTGGYPVVAVVASADLTTLAQARPGTKISFVPVERAEALAARRQRRAALNPMSGAVPPRRRR